MNLAAGLGQTDRRGGSDGSSITEARLGGERRGVVRPLPHRAGSAAAEALAPALARPPRNERHRRRPGSRGGTADGAALARLVPGCRAGGAAAAGGGAWGTPRPRFGLAAAKGSAPRSLPRP